MSSRILPEFELLLPESIAEAVALLGKYGDEVAVMAGGTDLLVAMKAGFTIPYVLGISDIPALDYVDYDASSGLRIGAGATLKQVLASTDVKEKYPALWKSTYDNGTAQTRNMATVVGNILRASPAGDCCCAVLAHGGSVVLEGPGGRREVDIDDFWVDYRMTARKPDEMAVELKLPVPAAGTVSAFDALGRTKKDLAKINVAASLTMDGNTCRDARFAIGAVAPTHIRLKKAEKLVIGAKLTDEILAKVAEIVPSEISPIDDIRSTAEYRQAVAGPLLCRAIRQALNAV
jgi:aerobic carbon-monoxide dehydrogenase medium subunit